MAENDLVPVAVEIQLYSALLLKFFNQGLEQRLHACGERIGSLQHGILRMLQSETLTVSQISQRLGFDPSTVVRAVDGLERKGLARRGHDPRDRRRNPITITDKGLERVAAAPVIASQDLVFQALQSLGAESSRQLRDLLRRLVRELPEGRIVSDRLRGSVDRP